MNWDLWRSHGRIFAYWHCLLFIVLVGRNFVSGICKLKLFLKNLKKQKNNFFVKNLGFSPALTITRSKIARSKGVSGVCLDIFR